MNGAVKVLRSKVMIADADLVIRGVNESLLSLLREAEPELKRQLPRFSVASLIGSNIDVFHKEPQHQRRMLRALERAHEATIRLGDRAFDLVVTPLMRGGKRDGFVVEWSDAQVRLQNVEFANRVAALGRSQAVIEFSPEGVVLDANDRFLKITGYALEEIRGQHHRTFVADAERNAVTYGEFWQDLRAGHYKADEYKRIGKHGRVVWLQASYNPILDDKGRVAKVVKYATDVTRRVEDVQRVQAAISALAAGDLAERIGDPLSPELDALRTDFNRAVEKLQDSLQHVRSGSEGIARRTDEIRASTDDLSRRTEQQAASLEETAAALNEVTKTVTRTSEGAQRASSIVGTARQSAESSAEVVREAIEAMKGIEASSRQIGQIIGVIDEIAFQTNLLALNAGVEAARAGDAGRGFAVVASEVRALAQRSADAAKQIKSLIQTSVGQVDQGVSLVCRTGEVLTKIVEQVADISTVVSGIATSAQEQATALIEVNTVVAEMDRTTQQNAAMVEETTAATHSLAQESAEVTALIQQFRLAEAVGSRIVPHRLPDRPRPRAVDRPAPRALSPSARLAAIRPAGARAAAPKLLAPPVAEPEWQEF